MEAAPWAGSLEALIYNASGIRASLFAALPLHELVLQYLPLDILRK